MNRAPMLSASLLSADMACFTCSIRQVTGVVHYLHCDVMDNHFVPNLTFGAPVVKALKKATSIPLDVHLMIEKPGRWIEDFLNAGLDGNDFLTFHIEAEPDALNVLERIRKRGVRPGIAVKPKTSAEAMADLMNYVDQVLVMTVEPGFGGQKFMSEMLGKIEEVRAKLRAGAIIGVDGGIDSHTAPLVYSAGAELLVAGNAIFGADNPGQAAMEILKSIDIRKTK